MKRLVAAALLALALAPFLGAAPAHAQLATTQIRILGLAVDVDTRPDLDGLQATMTAVRDVPTGLATFVGSPADAAAKAAPPGAMVKAELSGPTFGAAAVTIAGPPNQLLEIPLLRVAGLHYVTDVRLEDAAGNVLLVRDAAADPVVIDVLDQLLVTQVTSRELTLEEIRAKGIVIDEDNFTVLNFAVALTLGSERVTIEFPSIVPAAGASLQELEVPQLTQLSATQGELRRINIPNFSLTGFRMRAPPEEEAKEFSFPPVDGVIIIPGNLAFLNQFFSVIVQATNTAPDGSGLVLRGARASIRLPEGDDAIPETGDDPLRVAETGTGGVQTELPLVDAEGLDSIVPQGSNAAEFLVEGLREGTHRVDFTLAGDLFVPALGRTVPLEGIAAGIVQVRNPTFSIVLAHPRVVREGEPYSIFATVTNTSSTMANLFSIELARRSLSGARFAEGETAGRTLETLRGGESETFEWRLVARTTGEVTGTVFLADPSINGSFVLTAGVGDTGIPLSPDTLVLPQTADALPDDFLFAAVRMLGQAYSVATAPGGSLPADVARIGKAWVFDRAVRIAQSGLHVIFGERTDAAVQEVVLDWFGNDRARLETLLPDAGERSLAERDLRAWDALRRAAGAGEAFARAAGRVLGEGLEGAPVATLLEDLAQRFASRPAFLAIGASSRDAAVALEVRDPQGARLGTLDPAAMAADEIPFAGALPIAASGAEREDLVLVASPGSGAYTVAFRAAQDAARFALSFTAVLDAGLVLVTYPEVALAAGGAGRVVVLPGAAAPSAEIDADGDGNFETALAPSAQPIADAPPSLVGVQQWGKGAEPSLVLGFENGDPLGRLVGVLFSEEVTQESAEAAGRYAVAENAAVSVALQPDRRLAFIVLREPVGPFVPRDLVARDVDDLRGHRIGSTSRRIAEDPERGVGGRFSGQVVSASGEPVPFATVEYIQPLSFKSEFCSIADFSVATLQADAEGRFDIDFVLQNDHFTERICTPDIWLNERGGGATNHFKLEATDPETGEIGRLSTRVSFDGQHMSLRVVIRGTASLEGRVLDPSGAPVVGGDPGTPEALQVLATNLSTGGIAAAWVDADGRYAFPRSFERSDGTTIDAPPLVVGNVALQVVRPLDLATGVTTVNLPAAGARVVADIPLFPAFTFGSLSGRVVDADGVTPAANVVVQLAGRVLSGFGFEGRSASEGLIGSTTTDAAGVFRFESVPAGDVRVVAQRASTFEQAEARGVVESEQETDLSLVFPGQGGSVRGRVLDAFGQPVAFALVAGGPTLTNADADGFFEIRGLPLGTFTIQGQGFESPSLGEVRVTTTGPEDVQEVVITLGPVGTLTGTLTEADGATPIASQKVQLWIGENGGGSVIAETFTDDTGGYRFRNYPVAQYSVRAIREADDDGGMAPTEIRFAGDVRDVDFSFRGQGTIRGRVVQDNGTPVIADVVVVRKVWRVVRDTGPIDNAALGVAILESIAAQVPEIADFVARTIDENGLNAPSDEFFLLLDEPALLRSDILGPGGEVTGRFEFGGDAAGGPFTVAALGPFLTPAFVEGEIPRTTVASERDVDVGDIVLEPATSAVHGTVFLPDGVTPVGEGVVVRLQSLTPSGDVSIPGVGSVPSPVPPTIEVETDEDGEFEFPLVLRGGFVLSADTGVPDPSIAARSASEIQTERFADEAGERLLNVRLRGHAIGAAPKLPLGEFVTADLRLQDVAGARVRVVENDGVTPVEGARVTLVTDSNLDDALPVASTDENGEIDLFPLAAGSFSVSVTVPGSPQRGVASGALPVDPPNGFEAPVTVRLGAITTASGQVVDAIVLGSVTGTVLRADGTPLANPAQVRVRAGGIEVLATSGPDGRFRADAVPGGAFRVDVFEPFTARRGVATGRLVVNDEVVDVPVTLVGLGQVTGSVFANDGSRTLPGLDVVLLPSGNFSDRLVTRTDATGVYALPGVPLGPYAVLTNDFETGLTGSAVGTLARDGDLATTDVYLEPSGGIAGIVYAAGVLLDAQGAPIRPDGSPFPDAPVAAGAEVTIEGGAIRLAVQTAGDGSFVTPTFLPVGTYALTARSLVGDDGTVGSVRIGFDGDVAFVPLALRGVGRVEGVVLDSIGAGPVEGASVTLASSSPFRGPQRTRITGADGRFAFEGVPVGAFSITVRTTLEVPALGGAAQGELTAHDEALFFEDGDLDPERDAIRLQEAGAIAFSVLLEDGSTPAEGAVATLDGGGLRLSRVTDAAGALLIEGIPLGSYTLTVRETVTNGIAARAVVLAINGEEIDLGTLVLDASGPAVVETSPGASASGVDPSQPIGIEWSEPVDPATVTDASFVVSVGGEPVAGAIDVAADGRSSVFRPDAPLPDLRSVAVALRADRLGFEGEVLEPGVRDPAGNTLAADFVFSFTTRDSTPPALVSVSPAPDASEVAPNAVVRFEFSEPITRPSIDAFRLRTSSGADVAGELNEVPILGDRVVVFTPAAPLAVNEIYTAELAGPVEDRAGNPMADAVLATRFATVDTRGPALSSFVVTTGEAVSGGTIATRASLDVPEAGARVEFLLNGALVFVDAIAPYEHAFFLAPTLGSAAALRAVAIDAFGNRGAPRDLPITIDANRPPQATLLAPAAGSVSQGETIAVEVRGTDDVGLASLRFLANGGAAGGASALVAGQAATRSFAYTIPSDLPDGASLRIVGTATDTQGLGAESAAVELVVADARGPTVAVTSPAADTVVAPGTNVEVTLRAEDPSGVSSLRLAASVLGFDASQAVTPVTSPATATFTLAIPAGSAPGSLVLVASASDALGNAAARNHALRIADVRPPAVVSIDPADGAEDVARATAVRVVFDEPVARTSVTPASLSLRCGGAPVEGGFAFGAGDALVTFTPAVPLALGAACTIDVTAGVTDVAGNALAAPVAAGFTVVAPDTTAPFVVSVAPPGGAEGVARDTAIAMTFSEPVAAATLPGSVGLEDAGGASVLASVQLSPDGRVAMILPAAPLAVATLHRVFATASLTDVAGNPLTPAFESRFTTAGADVRGPRLVSLVPLDGAAGVSVRPLVRACFDEPLDPASFDGEALRVVDPPAGGAARPGALVADVDPRCVAFALESALDFDRGYAAELRGTLRGADGNPVADAVGAPIGVLSHAFTTGSFAIVRPADEERVVERTPLTLEAAASAGLGVATVVFTVNGTELAPVAGPPFATAIAVPASSEATSLTIVASARTAAGAEIATDSVTLSVVVGLRFDRAITGVPIGSGALRLVTSGPSASPIDVELEATDPSLVTVPARVVFPARASELLVPVTGLLEGSTSVVARSSQGETATVASIGTPEAGATIDVVAAPVGAVVVPFPSAGEVVVPVGATRALTLRILDAPAAQNTTVTVRSSNASIAEVVGAVTIAAGSTDASIAIRASGIGEAVLTLVAGDTGRELRVIAGDPDPARTPPVVAPPVGITIVPFASAGDVVVPLGATRSVTLSILDAPAAANTAVTVRSSDATVATVIGSVVIPAGSTDASFEVTAGVAGEALLTLVADGVGRELRVIAGNPEAGNTPPVFAAPVGITIVPFASAGDVVVPLGATRSVTLAILAAPAAANTAVTVRSSDATVATVTGPVVIPAGSTDASFEVTAGVAGEALLTLVAGDVGRELRVIAGNPEAGNTPPVFAPPVGITIVPFPAAGDVVVPVGTTRSVTLRILDTPAVANTPVTVASSDPAIANVVGAVSIPAGSTDASFTIATGQAGEALLTVIAGGVGRELRVVAGNPSPNDTPPVFAPPVGLAIQEAGSAGTLFLDPGTTRAFDLDLLAFDSLGDLPVSAASLDPGIATVSPANQTIATGDRGISLVVTAGSAAGTTRIDLVFGVERRTLVVEVGVPPANRAPLPFAPPVGACIRDAGLDPCPGF